MPATVQNCGSYLIEMDVGTLTNRFILDDPVAGVLDSTLYFLDGSPDFRDISTSVMDCDIERGRKNPFNEESATPGTCNLVINNNNFHFSVMNTASPYWNATTNRLGFEKGTGVRVSREGEYLFWGSITSMPQRMMLPKLSTVTVQASDDLFKANNVKIPAQVTVAERTDQRITKVLDGAGMFPANRTLDVGVGNLGTAPIDGNTSVRDYLGRINASEAGRVFVSRSGRLTMQKRIGAIQVNLALTVSDNGTNVGYTHFEIANN